MFFFLAIVAQIVTEYADSELDMVLKACEDMENHLTAAVVSNDVSFQRRVLENTVNGTTYCGIRARRAAPESSPIARGREEGYPSKCLTLCMLIRVV